MSQAKVKITATDDNGRYFTQHVPPHEVAPTVRVLKGIGYTKVVTEYHSND